jgi:hypothetical protein
LTRSARRADNGAREVPLAPESARQQLRDASLELARLRRIRGASQLTWRRIAGAKRRLVVAAALVAATAPVAEPAGAADPLFRHGLVFDASALLTEPYDKYPTLADLDGDGDLDAVVSNYARGILRFDQTSPGVFAAPVAAGLILPPGKLPTLPALADLDGDGDLDAFVGTFASQGPGTLLFFANTGTATTPAFVAPSTNPFGLAGVLSASYPALADLDGDGDFDLLVGNNPNLAFFRNTGSASSPAFAAPETNPFGLTGVGYDALPALADVDGDGDLDLFVGEFFNTVFFENTGTATAPAFAAGQNSAFGLSHPAYRVSPAFGDVDGDGDLDALVGGYHAHLVLHENTGTATAPAFVGAGNPFGINVLDNTSETQWYESPQPDFADLDGDGDLDALVGARHLHLSVRHFENTGSALTPAFAPAGGLQTGASPAAADLDGDGDLDILTAVLSGNLLFFRNTGNASAPAFASASTNPFGLANVGADSSPELADLDGDGDLDALVSSGGASRTRGSSRTPARRALRHSRRPRRIPSASRPWAPSAAGAWWTPTATATSTCSRATGPERRASLGTPERRAPPPSWRQSPTRSAS